MLESQNGFTTARITMPMSSSAGSSLNTRYQRSERVLRSAANCWTDSSSAARPQNSWSNALYVAGHDLAYVPGTAEQYSNAGYYLLGEVITQARAGAAGPDPHR